MSIGSKCSGGAAAYSLAQERALQPPKNCSAVSLCSSSSTSCYSLFADNRKGGQWRALHWDVVLDVMEPSRLKKRGDKTAAGAAAGAYICCCLHHPTSSSTTVPEIGSSTLPMSSANWQEFAFHDTPTSRGSMGGVPVYVMLPLDSVNMNNTVNRRRALDASLLALKSAGVEGIMVDVWWGIVEKDVPGQYNWTAYKELIDLVWKHGLKVQAVMSFHQCGGNVGDSCYVPLPRWVVEEIDQDPDLVYTDKSMRRNYEYLSLGCDMLPVLQGRTPIQAYSDFMRSFRDTFEPLLGEVINVSTTQWESGSVTCPDRSCIKFFISLKGLLDAAKAVTSCSYVACCLSGADACACYAMPVCMCAGNPSRDGTCRGAKVPSLS